MIEFPSILPNIQIAYDYNVKSAVISNQMESGRMRQRKRFDRKWKRYRVEWKFSNIQLAIFEGFVEHELANGANEFQAPFPVPGEDALQTVKLKLLGGTYETEALVGLDFHRVSAEVFVENPKVLSKDDYDILVYVTPSNSEEFGSYTQTLWTTEDELTL